MRKWRFPACYCGTVFFFPFVNGIEADYRGSDSRLQRTSAIRAYVVDVVVASARALLLGPSTVYVERSHSHSHVVMGRLHGGLEPAFTRHNRQGRERTVVGRTC